MITEQELMAIADRKERFELSMIYMMLHGGGTFIDPLTLDDVKAIRSTVLHVCNGMDCTSQKEGTEYFNVEAGDNGYKGMLELREKQAVEELQRRLLEQMNRDADEQAAQQFKFSAEEFDVEKLDELQHAALGNPLVAFIFAALSLTKEQWQQIHEDVRAMEEMYQVNDKYDRMLIRLSGWEW